MRNWSRACVAQSALFAVLLCMAPAPLAGQTWTPPQTPDGQPDIQGVWAGGPGSANAGHSLEEGCCELAHNRMQGRSGDRVGLRQQVIIDPPNGTDSISAVGGSQADGTPCQPVYSNRSATRSNPRIAARCRACLGVISEAPCRFSRFPGTW